MKATWIIYDRNLRYAERLQDFFRKKEPLQVSMQIYSDEEALKAHLDRERATVLIVGEESFRDWMEERAELSFILGGGSVRGKRSISVDRYRSAEKIWEEITDTCAVRGRRVRMGRRTRTERGKIISLFSPARRVLQTTLALQLGRALAEKGDCLYLHFDAFAGMERAFACAEKRSLTDILYLCSCGRENAFTELSGALWRAEGLSVLPRAGGVEELRSVSAEEWCDFLEGLREKAAFSSIVLDLREYVDGLFDVLSLSDRYVELHRPREYEDIYDRWRQESFATELGERRKELLSRRETLYPPYFGALPRLPAELGRGETYEYARHVLRDREA